jgi:hypothetical protein
MASLSNRVRPANSVRGRTHHWLPTSGSPVEVGLNYCGATIDAFRGARAEPNLLGFLRWFWVLRDGLSAVRRNFGMATWGPPQKAVGGDADRKLGLGSLFRRGDFSQLEILFCRAASILWHRDPLSYFGSARRADVEPIPAFANSERMADA